MENMGYDLMKKSGLNFGKGELYFDLLFSEEKHLIIITEFGGGWAMCQLQFRQPRV